MGNLRVTGNINDLQTASEIRYIKLLDDRKRDSLATAALTNGSFTLTARLPMHEVYFLEIAGKSTRRGTSGLDWKEHIPVYLEGGSELTLQHQPFNHDGSISKAKFSIAGGGEEQQLINDWQNALNDAWAEKESQMEHFSLGAGGATKLTDTKNDSGNREADITQGFIQQKRPLVTSLFLIYTTNEHRQYATDYRALHEAVSSHARQTKYGIDLAQRLDRILSPVQRLDPETQLMAVNKGLAPINWEGFSHFDFLLLSFWKSGDKGQHTEILRLEKQAPALDALKTAVIHLSVDHRFTTWEKLSEPLNLQHNYKIRKEALQPLIDSLYLTDLPRYVLIRPNGDMLNADVAIEHLPDILEEMK
ncbi:DUF4369 domain-containing protein [Parapedobacter composti]|nr:DUF4369 domain-containing protein [Parapedobacter composti]